MLASNFTATRAAELGVYCRSCARNKAWPAYYTKAVQILENTMYFKALSLTFQEIAGNGLYLNEIRKNRPANLEGSLFSHSHGYGSADDRPTLLAGTPDRVFSLSFVPFMQYAG